MIGGEGDVQQSGEIRNGFLGRLPAFCAVEQVLPDRLQAVTPGLVGVGLAAFAVACHLVHQQIAARHALVLRGQLNLIFDLLLVSSHVCPPTLRKPIACDTPRRPLSHPVIPERAELGAA